MRFTREATLAILLLLLVVGAAILEPKFVTVKAQALLAAHFRELAIVAIPMLLIIITGGIDLSVGSMVALCAVTFGLAFEQGAPPALAALLGVLMGIVLGGINGWFVAKLRVHPLLVTLATLAAFRGVAEGISLGRPLSGYPESFTSISTGPIPVAIFLSAALGAHFLLTRTRRGRELVAIGVEERVSRFSKIPVDRVKLQLYIWSGLACGIAAILLVARNNTAKADLAIGYELEAITAVVLGGASIEGGKGRVAGLLLALVLIHELRQFVSWHWKQNELNLIVVGSLLILTLLAERIFSRRNAKVAQY